MKGRILVKGGEVICPASQIEDYRDLVIENGRIVGVEHPGNTRGGEFDQVVDGNGCWVVPGLIDLHVHLREPGFEWKETIKSGSEAALIGGFTSICSMPNTKPANDSAQITKFILEKAELAQLVRVLPIGSITVGLKGEEMSPLTDLREAGCVAFSDDGEPVKNAGIMKKALEWCLALGVPLSCHEEDKSLSCGGCMNESPLSYRMGLKGMPKVAEEVMIARDIELALTTGGKVHICHVSSARSTELVRRAKEDGVKITCEVTPHHLTLTEDAVGEYDTNAKMSPPLREEKDVIALREGLKSGVIDCVASDHAPHELDSKRVEFSKASFGILGLQTSLPLLLNFVRDGFLSRRRAIEALTAAPARAFGLEFGKIGRGAVADVTVIDPQARVKFDREVVRSLSYNSPFLGTELIGCAKHVIVGGAVRLHDMKVVGRV